MSQQLVFDLLTSYPVRLENFVAGQNAEALAQIKQIARGKSNSAITYLWGASGTGKTHLASSAHAAALVNGIKSFFHDNVSLAALDSSQALNGSSVLHVIDDVHKLQADAGMGLFALVNWSRLSPTVSILTTGDCPPASLNLKPELRSRLAWGLVYQLQPLADHDKANALRAIAEERGVKLSADLVPYLLNHSSRDMRALIGLFDTLDQYALARNRAITLPLLREYLQLNPG